MDGKLSSIQILRGLAASLVVFLHILASMDTYYNFSFLSSYPALAAFLESGVDIFFVISGFIMFAVAKNKFGQNYSWIFIKKRAFRVLPIYWIFTLAYAVLLLVVPTAFNNSSFDLNKLIQSLLFIPHHNNAGDVMPVLSVGWTLNFEMYFYFCFSIALLFRRKSGIICALVILLIGFSLQYLFDRKVALSVISNTLLLEFLMGVLASAIYFQIYTKKDKLAILLNRKRINLIGWFSFALICIYWIGLYEYLIDLQLPRFILWGGPSLLSLVVFISFEPYIKQWKICIYIGDISYSLYLIQVFTLPIVIKIAVWSSFSSLPFIILVGCTQYLVSLVAASWSFKQIEIPMTEYLNRTFIKK
jgi:exopolysaccharide production protein ExoZ